jgi:NADH-quinone oxidoreductase subunit J
MSPDLILFLVLALVAVGAAVGMLLARNAVHSALFLILNFAVVAVFFLILGAPFIALVQVTVYAGAIMVLFLFVIMLLGAERLRQPGNVLPRQVWWAFFLGLLFVGAVLVYVLVAWGGGGAPPAFAVEDTARKFGGPLSIGQVLFSRYLLPFELTSLLLLVGMIGAVVLTRDEKKISKSEVRSRKSEV